MQSDAFRAELDSVLPSDLPNRENVVIKAAQHLALIVEANQYLNLTRITTPREAAIKHVLDSVIPWRLFANAHTVLDAGTGPGFPGIPLSLVLPDTQFTLAESNQKKARFVETALAALELPNVAVSPRRAEELQAEVITARALAPISRAVGLFGAQLKKRSRIVLYKGPDIEEEIAEAAAEIRKQRVNVHVISKYELPDALGTRTIVEIAA
jgi:16S rRNA (guanine527-N7)-methyltransferase